VIRAARAVMRAQTFQFSTLGVGQVAFGLREEPWTETIHLPAGPATRGTVDEPEGVG
jgi:hypothetical protein